MILQGKLTHAERSQIRQQLSTVALWFLVFLTILFGLIVIAVIAMTFIFDKQPKEGIIDRGIDIIGFLLFIYLLLLIHWIGHFLDLLLNKKYELKTTDYSIKKKKYGVLLKIHSPKTVNLKIYCYPKILIGEQIRIEYSKWSKTVLTFTQNGNDMMDETAANML